MFELTTFTRYLRPEDRTELVRRVLEAQAAAPAGASHAVIGDFLLADADEGEPDIDAMLELMEGAGEPMQRPE